MLVVFVLAIRRCTKGATFDGFGRANGRRGRKERQGLPRLPVKENTAAVDVPVTRIIQLAYACPQKPHAHENQPTHPFDVGKGARPGFPVAQLLEKVAARARICAWVRLRVYCTICRLNREGEGGELAGGAGFGLNLVDEMKGSMDPGC